MDRIKGRSLLKLNIPILTFLYIVLVCIIFVSIYGIPKTFNKLESDRTHQILRQIDEALEKINADDVKVEQLNHIIAVGNVDLVVQTKEDVLYTTLPVTDIDLLNEMNNHKNISYYATYQMETGQHTYQVWITIYQPDVQSFFEGIIVYLSVFIVLLFTIILVTITKMTNNLLKPLERLKNNILKLKDFRLNEVADKNDFTKYDGLLYDLSEFSDDLQGKMDDFGLRYTGLERELQAKQERMIYKEQLTGALIHDLKNPLTLSGMQLEKMADEYDGPTKLLNEIELLKNKNEQTLEEIKTALKMIYSDNVTLEPTQISLIQLIQETVNRFKPLLKQKKIFTSLDTPEEVFISMDAIEAKQLIHNVISNVAQYTKEKGSFDLSVFETDQTVTIKVYNESDQVHKIDFAHVFDLFYHSETQENRYGTGVGMYTIKAMVEKYGGDCEFKPCEEGVLLVLNLPKKSKEVL